MPSTGETNGDQRPAFSADSTSAVKAQDSHKFAFVGAIGSRMQWLRQTFESDSNLTPEVELLIALGLALFVGNAFYFSISANQQPFDYTVRIAVALLHGRLGIDARFLSWLNELVPKDKTYYSVFPLGAVLSMLPVAVLQVVGVIKEFPARVVSSVLAGGTAYYFFRLSSLHASTVARRVMLALFPVFGAWTWCNLGFAGAWQLALGFALIGEVGALYYALVAKRFFVAGIFFAIAFGNRTELILTLPLFLYFCWQHSSAEVLSPDATRQRWIQTARCFVTFMIVPGLLGAATAAYNYARFGSIFDFGYAHIPKVLEEPWYRHGLFSLHAIPWNIHKMLFEGMDDIPNFPYLRPHSFGCSIFIASPFLFLLFREGGAFRRICWIAIAVLTFALWCHGNPGGWQFSYRYGMILLPWMFLIILSNGPAKLSVIEVALFVSSVAINAIGTYQLK